MKSELVPLNDDPPIAITRDLTVVGRREYCDVVIEHPSLSKRHCVIVRTDGLLMIRDLLTTNGTKVNGQRVMWAALLPNDRLTLGGCKFRVYLGPDDQPSPGELARAKARAAAPPPPRPAAPASVSVSMSFATPTPDPALMVPLAPLADPPPEPEIIQLGDEDEARNFLSRFAFGQDRHDLD